MDPLSILLILLIGGAILFFSVPLMLRDARKAHGPRRALLTLGALLIALGAVGFFGSALSSVGGLNWLGTSFQWPVGFASGVITTPNQIHVVPHTPSGRVQLYDANWKFLRGWHVDASGGTFKLSPVDSSRFEVITARGQRRFVFDLDGRLLSQGTHTNYSAFAEPSEAYFVPTAPWLLIFSHPFLSWAAFALGMATLILENKLSKRRKPRR